MITGNRVRLRAIEKTDLPHFVEWLNDPEVQSGLAMYLPLSLEDENQWFEENQKRPPYERSLAIEILPGDSSGEWVFAGSCGLFSFDWRARKAEIGIHIGLKQYWDHGFGTRVMELLLEHGFHTLNLNRLTLKVFSHNPRAMHVYRKVGFVEEGILRQGHYYRGEYVDVHIMGILKSEWQEGKDR